MCSIETDVALCVSIGNVYGFVVCGVTSVSVYVSGDVNNDVSLVCKFFVELYVLLRYFFFVNVL